MRAYILNLLGIGSLRRQVAELTSERDYLARQQTKLIAQLFEGSDDGESI